MTKNCSTSQAFYEDNSSYIIQIIIYGQNAFKCTANSPKGMKRIEKEKKKK